MSLCLTLTLILPPLPILPRTSFSLLLPLTYPLSAPSPSPSFCLPPPCRRAFEKHFKEWRHQNGMRSLGIPNNKNFYEVTKIADAESLWANIQVGVGLGVRV